MMLLTVELISNRSVLRTSLGSPSIKDQGSLWLSFIFLEGSRRDQPEGQSLLFESEVTWFPPLGRKLSQRKESLLSSSSNPASPGS